MMTDDFALLIGADLSLRERAIVCTARALAMRVVLLAFPGRRRIANVLADDIIECDSPMNPQAAVAALRDYVRRRGGRLAAVVPINDFSLKSGSAVAREFGLPFLDDDVIDRCRDKVRMKKAFEAAGIPCARVIATDEAVLDHDFADGRPVVFKPTEFGGSGGVRLVHDRASLRSAWEAAQQLLHKYAQAAHVNPRRVHIEEYLDSAQEVSVEVYCTPHGAQVAAITQKFLSPEPYFAEVGHRVPYRGPEAGEMAKLAQRACAALGIDRGVAHVEIRTRPEGLYVIEVGARPGGDRIMDLVYRAHAIDLYGLHALGYADRFIAHIEPVSRGVAEIGFLKAAPGRIREVRHADDAQGILEIALYKGVGDTSEPLADFQTREGHAEWFWPSGITPQQELATRTDALAQTIFVVDPA